MMLPFPTMADYPEPAHDLHSVQEKAKVGFVTFRTAAIDGAAELELTRYDILACIQSLSSGDFHKSMDAECSKWAGSRQDVYIPTYRGLDLYVKFQLFPGQRLHIVSFKRK
jgi:hypothetical protein